ncbi:MAG: phosphoenolpyruvate--protein phosphotransferase [Rubricoccaceae bacterium]
MPFAPPPILPEPSSDGEVVVEGIGVAPGVAIGPVYLYTGGAFQADREHLAPDEVDGEVDRFERAVARSERELGKVVTVARQKLGPDTAAIFDAQLLILRDQQFYDAVIRSIQDGAVGAGWAVQKILEGHQRRMEASPSLRLRERAGDFLDVQNRVLRNLQQGRAISRIDENHIVVAQNLTAADILMFSRRGVLGCVMDLGGPTSHVSIMARALGVPTVVSLHELAGLVDSGDTIILDGFSGRVVASPTPETLERYRAKADRFARIQADRADVVAAASETRDGHPISLQANIEFREELPLLDEYGAKGIGLFRSEMLFLAQGTALDEDQQLEVYRDVVRAADPHPVTIRLLDLGGDKVLPFGRREPNPSLGWRGVRILLDKPDLLRPQLRAVLRASTDHAVRVLVPMISDVGEIHGIRRAIQETRAELVEEGVACAERVDLGIMVEVPAVALMAESYAKEVDFFSIGTNDLTQFTLAVDRGNDLVAGLYRELHPAVLGLIQHVAAVAADAGIPISVCGEAAGNPRIVPLLIGLGVTTLSASPAYLPMVKRVVRELTMAEAQDLADRVLRQPDADAVSGLLNDFLASHNRDLAALLGLNGDAEPVPA